MADAGNSKLLITICGNVANNGFFNHLLLNGINDETVAPRPATQNLVHAFSQPAWELHDLDLSDIGSLDDPNWDRVNSELNNKFVVRGGLPQLLKWLLVTTRKPHEMNRSETRPSDSVRSTTLGPQLLSRFKTGISSLKVRFAHDLSELVKSQRWIYSGVRTVAALLDPIVQSLLVTFLIWRIKQRDAIKSWVHVSIGPTRYSSQSVQKRDVLHVLLEHGTLRWSHSISSDRWDRQLRSRFRKSCALADHVWVTNLDLRSLELANEYCQGRWSALPHPYVCDPHAPYEPCNQEREHLLQRTKSDFLVLSASSLNLSGDQNKGTQHLLKAIIEIRSGLRLPIGFVFVEWGRDVQVVKDFCRSHGLQDFVTFIPPMSRIRLMRTMAACDLVADQFHLDAFGALSLRAWEQGMPVISRPISEYAVSLIGLRPPTIPLEELTGIAEAITDQFKLFDSDGRTNYSQTHRSKSRTWFLATHQDQLSQHLQLTRYHELLQPDRPPAAPDVWARALEHQYFRW